MNVNRCYPTEGQYVNISNAGLQLLKEVEGLSLVAYRDSVGILTISYANDPFYTEALLIHGKISSQILPKTNIHNGSRITRPIISTRKELSVLMHFTAQRFLFLRFCIRVRQLRYR